MTTFIISDTHFYHTNIIKLGRFDFTSIEQMNAVIMSNWNRHVGDNDLVLHLGDVSFGNALQTRAILSQLKGYKILVMGNYDKARTLTWWHKIGFIGVMNNPIEIGDYIFSHEPVEGTSKLNIHGHIHAGVHRDAPIRKFINVSVDSIGYGPIKLYGLLKGKGYI